MLTLHKIAQAARELNVCPRTIHTYINKYEEKTKKTDNLALPSSPANGLRPTIIHRSISGRITKRVDARDLTEYMENANLETLELPLNNWRAKS